MCQGSSDSQYPKRTFFAEAGRLSHDELAQQLRRTLEDPCVRVVLDTVTGFVMVLNAQRQILAANDELLHSLAMESPDKLVGIRPGEALNCVHFTEGPDGCGTSLHCRTCGAVLATLASQRSDKVIEDECRLSLYRNGQFEALELRVRATPLHIGNEHLTALVLHDISAKKRREALEETFFHDFLNMLGGIEGWSSLLKKTNGDAAAREIVELSARLKEEILAQRTLLEAESGKLKLNSAECAATSLLERLHLLFEHHPAATERTLIVESPSAETVFRTDPSLLLRVLANMIKNALEATEPGGQVRLWFELRDSQPTFLVNNAGVIPEDVRARIFERSFSTRAKQGRGLGTYSMKLYGERYLGGTVAFSSEAPSGTTFWISLPASQLVGYTSPAILAASTRTTPVATPGKRILLVDDEESLLRLAELFLNQLGYDVVACESSEQALRFFQDSPDSFAAVITDMTMPKMNGVELARRITGIRPVPVLLCTGWGNADSEEHKEAGIAGIITKPFTVRNLSSEIAKVLQPAEV
jgi:signal transduction histidine kinase/CheY-like chemotaxis protein